MKKDKETSFMMLISACDLVTSVGRRSAVGVLRLLLQGMLLRNML
jgi:hypothetical protein